MKAFKDIFHHEFQSNSTGGLEYGYDGNGSLIWDANKQIAHIAYDNLNYPKEVQFTNGNRIQYVYSPDGRKLRATWQTAVGNIVVPLNSTTNLNNSQISSTTRTDYIGNVIYTGTTQSYISGDTLSKYLFDGGYATVTPSTQPVFHYYTQDHLGNNRAVVNQSGTVEQITHYYPFGGFFADAGTNSSLQPYKYNGKELDRMHGLDLYDYGFRQYDPVVPMFTQQDPMAEKYYHLSPYVYCGNNPVNAIDYEGKRIIFVQGYLLGRPSGANYWGGNNSSFVKGAQKYFNDNDKPYFTDNDISYMKSSTMMRYQSGYNYAKRNYAEITEGLSKGEDVFYFVSHSMGGEFSEGMATYLIENGWNVNTMMHFNAWLPTEMYGTEGPIRVDLTTIDDIVQGLSIPVSGDRNIPNADYRIRKKSDKGFYFRHADLISNDEIWKGNQDWNSAMQTIRDLISTNPNIKIFVK